jgi:hypothetical protein
MEEFVKKAAQHRAGARLARVVPYDFDNEEKLDPMALLEEVMQHFYRKAKIEESPGRFCDFRIVDNALQNAARTAREIVSFDAAFLSQGQDRGELGPVLRFPDCRSGAGDGGTDRTRDCELPASSQGLFLGSFGRQLRDQPLTPGVMDQEHRDWARVANLTQPIAAHEGYDNKEGRVQISWPPSIATAATSCE